MSGKSILDVTLRQLELLCANCPEEAEGKRVDLIAAVKLTL